MDNFDEYECRKIQGENHWSQKFVNRGRPGHNLNHHFFLKPHHNSTKCTTSSKRIKRINYNKLNKLEIKRGDVFIQQPKEKSFTKNVRDRMETLIFDNTKITIVSHSALLNNFREIDFIDRKKRGCYDFPYYACSYWSRFYDHKIQPKIFDQDTIVVWFGEKNGDVEKFSKLKIIFDSDFRDCKNESSIIERTLNRYKKLATLIQTQKNIILSDSTAQNQSICFCMILMKHYLQLNILRQLKEKLKWNLITTSFFSKIQSLIIN